MSYNFDEMHNRRNTNSMKWDVGENELPMWVADMDFQTAPEIREALQTRVQQGIFGYEIVPVKWKNAIVDWWRRRHGFQMQEDWLIFTTGVIPAITTAVERMTNLGDDIVIMTPVYDIFFHSVENWGRHVLEHPLEYDNKSGSYHVDFLLLEEQLARPLTTMMILCNPHNPTGNLWSEEELQRMGELCAQYGVIVLSDEIHCDLTDPGATYTPFASVSEACRDNSIICISATKAFNMAGLQSAAVVITSKNLRDCMERGLNAGEVAEPNSFATEAVVAAFTRGEPWLEELRSYLSDNRKLVSDYLATRLPEIRVVSSQATYLIWMDCSRICENTTELCSCIRKETGLYLTAGEQYRGNGKTFIRMNVACPRSQVIQGLELLSTGVKSWKDKFRNKKQHRQYTGYQK